MAADPLHDLQQAVSLGTTIMAASFDGGVVLGADSRTSTGSCEPAVRCWPGGGCVPGWVGWVGCNEPVLGAGQPCRVSLQATRHTHLPPASSGA